MTDTENICLIPLNKFYELLPAFTCARAIGNLWSIYLGVSILSSVSFFDVNNGMPGSLEKLMCDALHYMFKLLFNQVYLW